MYILTYFFKNYHQNFWSGHQPSPAGLFFCREVVGEEFNICMEDTRKDITLACYELENGSDSEPEHLEIDFNNFP
jgi:hypothetical protein